MLRATAPPNTGMGGGGHKCVSRWENGKTVRLGGMKHQLRADRRQWWRQGPVTLARVLLPAPCDALYAGTCAAYGDGEECVPRLPRRRPENAVKGSSVRRDLLTEEVSGGIRTSSIRAERCYSRLQCPLPSYGNEPRTIDIRVRTCFAAPFRPAWSIDGLLAPCQRLQVLPSQPDSLPLIT